MEGEKRIKPVRRFIKLIRIVSKDAKIRNRYNQVPHLRFFLVLYMDAEKISKNISFPFNSFIV